MIFLLYYMFHIPFAFSWLSLLTQGIQIDSHERSESFMVWHIWVFIIFTPVKVVLGGDLMYPQESGHALP